MSVEHLRSTWEQLGQDDPLWAVLSDPSRKGGNWDVDEFLSTGRHWVKHILDTLHGVSLDLGDRVLDFGCGVGRLSFALAEHAREVTGVDIAASMVEHAARLNHAPDRIRFAHYDGTRLPFPDASFDAVVSLIVLQHAPPAVQLACLVEVQRVVRPGGTLIVQIPAGRKPPLPLPLDAMRARIAVSPVPELLPAGAEHTATVTITNVGAAPWPLSQAIRVGNHWLADGEIAVVDDGRGELPSEVAPGATVEVELLVTAPPEPGRYELEFDLLQESVAWFGQVGSDTVRVPVEVVRAPERVEEPESVTEGPAQMEMHAIPSALVRGVFEHCGCEVVAAIPDDLAGAEWESYTYLVRKT
ncbi:methyltransferase domain-containing protein [Actinokineospora sp.]|uniref:methyltransferase domain-containing protein n=1 Tax=Actinokineospora sp. TaxID=1872133 RepID=UPI004037ABBB